MSFHSNPSSSNETARSRHSDAQIMPDDQPSFRQQDISRGGPEKWCEEDATLSTTGATFMEPFGAASATVALVGGIVKTASGIKIACSDYKEAPKDEQHTLRQKEQLRINQTLLKSHQFENLDHFAGVQLALTEAAAAFESQPRLDSKRKKLTYAVFGGKHKAQKVSSKLKEIESSLGVTFQVKTFDEVERLRNSMERRTLIREDSHSSRLRSLEEGQERIASFHRRPEQQLAAKIYRCQWMLCFGIQLHLVVGDGARPTHALSLIFPLLYMVFILRLGFVLGWPRCPQMSLGQRIEVPADSAIFKACQNNNILLIQNLLTSHGGFVNCTTPDNLTPLHFAIKAGNKEAVKLLLDHGADSNQTVGSFDTSPLNLGFQVGSPPLVRLLLEAKADLYHLNSRAWTTLYYLWDSEPCINHHSTTCEILAICSEKDYTDWDFRDALGWAPIHRAAAFGHPDDIRMLFNMRAVSRDVIPMNVTQWSPIQCAARHGNIPAFECLAEEYGTPRFELLKMRDNRGWSLLHLAAAGGSEEMIVYLLSLGMDPTAETDAASILLKKELKYKRSTPRKVAEAYGFVQQFDDALQCFASKRSTGEFYEYAKEPQLVDQSATPEPPRSLQLGEICP